MTKFLGLLVLALLTVPALFAQQVASQAPPNPCAAAQQKQLEFWVGEWDASWPGAKTGEVDTARTA